MLARFSAPVTAAASNAVGAAVALVTPSKDWTQIKETTDTRIAELQTRRAGLYLERRDAVIEEIGGDTLAGQRAGKIDAHIADIDRELSRLHDVRGNAVDRIAAEESARADQQERTRLDGIIARTANLSGPLADNVNKKIGELAAALRAYADEVVEIRRAAERQEVHEFGADVLGALVGVTQHRLSTEGVAGFGVLPHGALELASGKLRPDVDYVIGMARKPR